MSSIRFINNSSPVKTYIGVGASAMAGGILRENGIGKAMLVCDETVLKFGLADSVIKSCEENGVELVIFDKVMPDPVDTMIDEACALYKEEGCQGVIAEGGGSVLDTGKCVSMLAKNPFNISYYVMSPMNPFAKGDFLLTIPTTSGTGSEVSNGAIVTVSRTGTKGGIGGPNLFADMALCDPLLTRTMPKAGTAATGMDVFAHAIEALLNAYTNPLNDTIAYDAIRLVVNNIKRAVDNGKEDIEARENMMIAAYYGGMNINDGPCNYGHSIAHTIGAQYHAPHGAVCAIASPLTIEHYQYYFPEKVRKIGEVMGLDIPADATPREVGTIVADGIRELNKSIGIPTLADFGIKYEDLPSIARLIPYDVTMYTVKATMPDRFFTSDDFLIPLQREYRRTVG